MTKVKLNLAIFFAIIFWGSALVGIRIGLTSYSPGCLTLLRFVVASICMLIIYLIDGKRQRLTFWQIVQVALVGMLGFSIYHFLLNYGLMSTQTAIASFIISQTPVLISLLSLIFLSERFAFAGWCGTLLSFSGLAIIAWNNNAGAHISFGVIIIMLAAFCGSLYTVLQKPLLKKIHPLTFSCYSIWGGTLFLLIFLPEVVHELPHATLSSNLAVIYIGIFPSAISYLLWNYALHKLSAIKLGSSLYALPFCVMFFGWLFLNEIPPIFAIFGGALALFGAYLVNQGTYTKK